MEFKHPPLKHQMDEWLASRDLPYRALFWEMGTGKSKVDIDTTGHLYLEGKVDVWIIVAKKGEYTNWKYVEIPEHMSPDVEYVCEVYRSGMREAEKEAIRRLCKPQPRLRILCINVESFNFDSKTRKMTTEGGKVAAAFLKSAKVGAKITIDESTCVKSYKAARSKAAQALAKASKYRRILSGTPVTRSPVDMWGQSLILAPGLLGHTSLTSFRSEFEEREDVHYGPRTFSRVSGHRNLERLTHRIRQFGSILERHECVDLPPKVYKKTVVPLTSQQEKLYAEMRDLALAELGDGDIVEATNALGVVSRLDQIACGQLKREDGSFEILDSNRPNALMEQIDVSQKRGIIWCNYRGLLGHLYEVIGKEFGADKVGRYYGGVPDDERERTVWEFQNGSNLTWIVANQQSMGYGRTLTKGKENYYYSNGYNLEHRLQSEDRTMRIGQDESVLYNDLFTPGTVNERVMEILRGKNDLSRMILGTPLRAWI